MRSKQSFRRDKSVQAIRTGLLSICIGLFALALSPLAYAGYRTIDGKRGWMWFGLIQCAFGLVQVVPPLFGVIFFFAEMYERCPLGRIIAYSMVTVLYAVQTIQYAYVQKIRAEQSLNR